MSAVNDILSSLPLDQLAGQLGTDTDTAERSARQGIESLLNGMRSNAGSPDGEASLARALQQHADGRFTGDQQVSVDDVDTEDGRKVAHHVLGNNPEQSVAGLLGGDMGGKLISILAPLVMGYLGNKMTGGAQRSGGQQGGGILGSILGSLGQGQTGGQQGGLGGLGDILGQFMGGRSGDDQKPSTPRSTTQGNSPFNV